VAHDVFICHSSEDKTLANAACAKLEAAGIRCWIAPRDPLPGIPYGRQLVSAIETSGIILLIFSGNANRSEHILRELELASDRGKIVVPYRIEDVKPTGDLEYYIRNVHWLDAMTGPVEARLDELVVLVSRVLETVPGRAMPATPATPIIESAVAAAAPSPAASQRAAGRGGMIFGAIGLVVALAAGAFAYATMNSHSAAIAPPPATAAPTAAAVATVAPKPVAAVAAPVHPAAEPTARIVYVEKPAAAAPAAKPSAHVAVAEVAKPAAPVVHEAVATSAPVALAPPPAAAVAQSAGGDSELRGLLTAAAGHFADVKGRERDVRGESEYVMRGGVSGLTNCVIHPDKSGALTSSSCRVYLGDDADAAQSAYAAWSAKLNTLATAAGTATAVHPRKDGEATWYTAAGGARLRVVRLLTPQNQSNVILWADAPP
jgi:hypothetical protein